jgi:type I restriction enzyme M protein
MSKKIDQKIKKIEETLWQSCDKLRGSVEPAEYKHVVLGLIFLKFASDKFGQRKSELIKDGKEKYVEMKDFYRMKNVFFLEDISRWNYIIKNAKQNDISLKIDTALNTIEKNNPDLKGALPDNYFLV